MMQLLHVRCYTHSKTTKAEKNGLKCDQCHLSPAYYTVNFNEAQLVFISHGFCPQNCRPYEEGTHFCCVPYAHMQENRYNHSLFHEILSLFNFLLNSNLQSHRRLLSENNSAAATSEGVKL